MPYTTPSTITTGQLVTATLMNNEWAGNISYLANPPACRVTNNAAQSIPNATWTALTFNTELVDTNTMHDTVTNTSRITYNTAGLYMVTCSNAFAANSTGGRGIGVRKNGTGGSPTEGGTLVAPHSSGVSTYISYSTLVKLAVTDYLEVMLWQASGGALSTSVEAGLPTFTAVWVGLG